MPAGQAKNWCFTEQANEKKGQHLTWPTMKTCPLDWWERHEQNGLLFLVCQMEKAPSTGKCHCQGYIALKDRTSLANIKRLFSATAHWEICRGTPKENQAYCTKEPRLAGPWEFGTLPDGTGTRSDLKSVYSSVKAGQTNFEILESTGGKSARFAKAINYMRFTVNETKSDRQLQGVRVVVLYGPTGTGKTYAAVNYFGGRSYHLQDCPATPNSKLWFDGYQDQQVLILDDFSGDFCNYRYLLKVLDKYKLKVEVKCDHVWALWTTVVITTNVHPANWYPVGTQTAPLQRRINEIRFCEEQGMYRMMDWTEHPVGDIILFNPPPPPPAPMPSTSNAATPVIPDDQIDVDAIPETPVPRKRLRRMATDMKEKQKEKDDILTDPDDE